MVSPAVVAEGLSGLRGSVTIRYRLQRRSATFQFIDDISSAWVENTGVRNIDNDAAVVQWISGLRLRVEALPSNFNPTQDNIAVIEQRIINGQVVDFPLGLYRLEMGEEEHHRGYPTFVTVDAHDLSFVLAESRVEALTVISTDTNYRTAEESILNAEGFNHSLSAVADVLPTDVRWDTDSSRRIIQRDLASGINYYTPWPDLQGRFIWRPKEADPNMVSPAVHYRDDDLTVPLMTVDPFRRRIEATDLYNRVATKIDDFEHPDYPYMALFEDADPESPSSTVNRRPLLDELRWDSDPLSTRCILDPAMADDISKTYLRQQAMRYQTATLQTLPDPRRGAHEYYMLTLTTPSGERVEDGSLWRVRTVSHPLQVGAVMTHELERVIPIDITEWEVEGS